VAICSFPGQDYNSATEHFVWLIRLPGHLFRAYINNFQKHTQDTFSHVLTSLTNCFAECEHQMLSGTFVVTLAMLLCLKNCRFIVIIII